MKYPHRYTHTPSTYAGVEYENTTPRVAHSLIHPPPPALTHLRLAGAWVAYQQHVHLAPDVCARVILARTAANECERHCELHQKEAVDLRADAGQDLVAALEGAVCMVCPEVPAGRSSSMFCVG
jgi:hypothetical protein